MKVPASNLLPIVCGSRTASSAAQFISAEFLQQRSAPRGSGETEMNGSALANPVKSFQQSLDTTPAVNIFHHTSSAGAARHVTPPKLALQAPWRIFERLRNAGCLDDCAFDLGPGFRKGLPQVDAG